MTNVRRWMAPLGALLCMAAFLLALWIQVQTHGFLTSLVDEFPDVFEDPLQRADPEKVHALVHDASWMTVLVHGVFCLGTGMVAAGLPERDSTPPRAYGGWVVAAVFCLVPWTVLMVCSVGSSSWDFRWPLADAGGFEIPLLAVAVAPGGRAQFLVWWSEEQKTEEQKTPAARPQLQLLLGRGSAQVPVGYSQDLQPGTGFTVREDQELDVGYWYTLQSTGPR